MTEVPQPELEVSVQRSAGEAIVRVVGELDVASAQALSDVLHSLERPCDRVILDLSELTFIDSTGLRLAVAEHRRAMMDGFDFVLAGATERVMRVLRLTGLDVALPIAPDLASARADADGRPR